MLTYNFANIGSDSLYEYLYKCIKNDIKKGVLEKNVSKMTYCWEISALERSCRRNGRSRKIWVSASLPSRMPMRSLLRKAICIPCQSADFMQLIWKLRIPCGMRCQKRSCRWQTGRLPILRIFPVTRRTARFFRLQSGRGRCVLS